MGQVNVTQDASKIDAVIDRAWSILCASLGFEFGEYPASTTDKVVYSAGGAELVLPPHEAGSVTTVLYPAGSTVPSTNYTQADGRLYLGGSYGYYGSSGWMTTWERGRYTVTAKWGYGLAPDSIKEVALELAVNIWRGADRGLFTDVIGVEGGGAVGYTGALTNQQKMVVNAVRRQYLGGLQYA